MTAMASGKVGADFDPDEDSLNKELIQCPYVPTHMIRPGTRWQRHLPKCRTEQLKQTTSPFHERALDMKVCKYGTLLVIFCNVIKFDRGFSVTN